MILRILQLGLWLTFRLFYRLDVKGMDNIERAGGNTLIVVNHVSLLDGPILFAALRQPAVFAIHSAWAERWYLAPLRHSGRLFAMDPARPMAAKHLIEILRASRGPVVIFPEGRLTTTGTLMKVHGGPAYIADRAAACVVPVRIHGAERSRIFTRLHHGQITRRLFPKITIAALPATRITIDPQSRGRDRRARAALALYDIMSDMMFRTETLEKTLFEALIDARQRHDRPQPVVEDVSGRKVNYRQLVIAAIAMGRLLARQSERGEMIGILLPNMTGTVIVFAALMATGRVAAMLNFAAGPANVDHARTTARIRTVISSRAFIERAKLGELADAVLSRSRIIWIEDIAREIGALQKLSAALAAFFVYRFHRQFSVSPDEPAVILFTSGSEGRPKAVVLSHRNIVANCAQIASRIAYDQTDRCFNALPMFHSFGLTGAALLPLLTGVPVYCYPSPLHFRIVPQLVYDSNATILFGTNTFLAGYARTAHAYDFHALRYCFAGGEKLQEATSRAWFEKFGVRILQGYGATETAPVLTLNTMMHYREGSVGRLLPGIDHKLEPVEGIEVGGKLLVKGPNVMLGYMRHDRPGELQPPEDGWYDTGDIVRIDDDGYLFILGRLKRFAKIGGEMVSLAQIEEILMARLPDCFHAIVTREDAAKGERMILVTTTRDIDRPTLRAWLREAGHNELWVPAAIRYIDRMPLLGTGKIDLNAVSRMIDDLDAAAAPKEQPAGYAASRS